MTEQSHHGLAEPLLAQLSGRFSPEELDQVAHAFDFADRWHEGQWRKSGDRYVTHPLAVAGAAATAGLGCTMVCAALLHDVLEDTGCDPELLRAEFGAEVADLVERHMALGHGEGAPDDDQAMTLKLLDRLHNMRTIEYLDADKQLSRSRQTLELLVPQARRLGNPGSICMRWLARWATRPANARSPEPVGMMQGLRAWFPGTSDRANARRNAPQSQHSWTTKDAPGGIRADSHLCGDMTCQSIRPITQGWRYCRSTCACGCWPRSVWDGSASSRTARW